MKKRLRVLVVTNEHFPNSAPGQKDAIQILAQEGMIESVEFVSHSLSRNDNENFERVFNALECLQFDVLMIWSPKSFPKTRDNFEALVRRINKRPIYYWEGDPWSETGIKKLPEQSKWWAQAAEIIFTVAKEPHTSMFNLASNAKVVFTPQTYCHVQFANEETSKPPLLNESRKVVMIGSQTAKIPFVYGTPGSGMRFLAGLSLKLKFRQDFHLFGKNWPRGISAGTVDYSGQANLIRSYAMSTNWDNFTNFESYASDRLPISLLAGRVHVTSSHPGTSYYGGEDVGLFQISGIREMHQRIYELRNSDPQKLSQFGLEAHKWCRNRFSHREAARFMFSNISDHVPRLSIEPWRDL